MITWEMCYRLLFERGLDIYTDKYMYEDDELRLLVKRYNTALKEINLISSIISDKVSLKEKDRTYAQKD